jgi:hypothetical protein
VGDGLDVVVALAAVVAGETFGGRGIAQGEQAKLVPQHQPLPHGVLAARRPRRAAQRSDEGVWITCRQHGIGHLGVATIEAAVEHGHEQVGLVGEVRVHRTAREPGRLGDAVEARTPEALGREGPLGGVEQSLAGLGLGRAA